MSHREDTGNHFGLKLLFFSANGVRFAVDAEQVAGTAAFADEAGGGASRLYELPGCDGRLLDMPGAAVMVIKNGDQEPLRVVVDSLDDMAGISTDEIRPFPPLIEALALQRGMWGVVERDGRLVLLLDFQRLMRNKDHETVRDGGD